MERRRVLQMLGAMAAAPALGSLSARDLVELGKRIHAARDLDGAPRAMSAAQYAIVMLAAERIIPRTDTPGATDVHVADFVDTMLADWYDPADRDRFLAGVDALAAQGFAESDSSRQVALLTALDNDVTALRQSGDHAANQHWFAMLKFLTVWGYYTSRPGFEQELREQFLPGYYKGDVPYTERREASGAH
jgi:gluconate 2-dehydrogenase gamma chain